MSSREQRIQQALHEGDELHLMMDALVARSREWTALWRQMLGEITAGDSRNRDDEQPEVTLAPEDEAASTFTPKDVDRSREWAAPLLQMLDRRVVGGSRTRGHERPAVTLAPEDDEASTFTQEDVDRLLQLREELLVDLIRASNRFLSLAPPSGEFAHREPT